MPKLALAVLLGALSMTSQYAAAATATGNLTVKLIITSECKVTTGTTASLDFGTKGVIDANIDQTGQISVQCTAGTTYNVGLDAGQSSGATVSSRKMTNGASTVAYSLYRDAGRTQNWGVTTSTDTVSGTGTGAAQILNVYGRVPPQSTPTAGTYNDTVAITITY